MVYIQRKCLYTRQLETVDQFETRKEAKAMLREYQLSDSSGHYYTSQRSTKCWNK